MFIDFKSNLLDINTSCPFSFVPTIVSILKTRMCGEICEIAFAAALVIASQFLSLSSLVAESVIGDGCSDGMICR